MSVNTARVANVKRFFCAGFMYAVKQARRERDRYLIEDLQRLQLEVLQIPEDHRMMQHVLTVFVPGNILLSDMEFVRDVFFGERIRQCQDGAGVLELFSAAYGTQRTFVLMKMNAQLAEAEARDAREIAKAAELAAAEAKKRRQWEARRARKQAMLDAAAARAATEARLREERREKRDAEKLAREAARQAAGQAKKRARQAEKEARLVAELFEEVDQCRAGWLELKEAIASENTQELVEVMSYAELAYREAVAKAEAESARVFFAKIKESIPHKRGHPAHLTDDMVRAIRRSTLPLKELSALCGMNQHSLGRIRNGVTYARVPDTRPRKADAHKLRSRRGSKARMTDDQVRAIRISSGSREELKKRFGLTCSCISKIRRRRTYRYVEDQPCA